MQFDVDTLTGEGTHSAALPERRRERRESRRIAMEVSGFDARGRFFTERTSTVDVSDSSCSFLLNAELQNGGPVSIRLVHSSDEVARDDAPLLFRVACVRHTHPGWPKWTIAATRIHPAQPSTAGSLDAAGRLSQEQPASSSRASATAETGSVGSPVKNA